MKLIDQLKTTASLVKNTLRVTTNDYRWFFIPTIQYHTYKITVVEDEEGKPLGDFRDHGVKAHFLCWTLTIYNKRTPI